MPQWKVKHIKSQNIHTDTVGTDTTTTTSDTTHQQAVVPFVPAYVNGFPDSVGNNAQFINITESPVMTIPQNAPCEPYSSNPLHDAGTMGLVFVAFIFIAVSYKTGYKYVSNFAHNLFSVRKRQNMFDDHTVSETQIMSALITNSCLLEGLLLYLGIHHFYPGHALEENVFKYVSLFTGIAGIYTLWQLALYWLLGFIFARKVETKLWLDGFKAAQSVLGLVLFPVVFIILLYPTTIQSMLICSLILYFLARLVFICKGFRIFFNNLSSCVYFILYLCTVEIVPVILMLAGAVYLSEII